MRSGLNPHPRCDPGGYAAEKQMPISKITRVAEYLINSLHESMSAHRQSAILILLGCSIGIATAAPPRWQTWGGVQTINADWVRHKGI